MFVYFMRHGLVVEPENWEGDDRLRPLTDEGRAKLEASARTIARLGLGVQLVLTSPVLRARETARIVAAALGAPLAEDERLAHLDEARLAALLADDPQPDAVLLVGHEPDLGRTIAALIGGGRIALEKGSLARVHLAGRDSREADLDWLVPQRLLAG